MDDSLLPPPHRGPPPPRLDLWPAALRSAETLRGSLVRCGPGHRSIGWPETPRVRATALAPWLDRGYVAAYLTAAWVWGAARSPGSPLQFSTPAGVRRPDRCAANERVRQLSHTPADVTRFGAFGVMTPVRTVSDLLRLPGRFPIEHAVACRLLFRNIPGGAAAVSELLRSGPARHRRIALERLGRISTTVAA
ncbi:hypothetical protein JD276_03920 [Leucobacter sp. CSA1]|uniref:AbiEi antitoxin C-terminal domain-containing protein n=1 Tax=Leucobacter chromiisoli TaxID=2796471 RepID=A0A934UTW6_9MICO|nr:hypothetical protein [Leucobacter chromiisoli]MBK0418175.1 hypothetical protein [Leucobacter chromiisoli]